MVFINQLIENYGYAAVFRRSLIGMLISYGLGKRIGCLLLDWLVKWLGLSQNWSKKAEYWIHQCGASVIIVSHFVPGMRYVVGIFCGISHMPIKTYTLYVGTSALLGSLLFLTLGRIF